MRKPWPKDAPAAIPLNDGKKRGGKTKRVSAAAVLVVAFINGCAQDSSDADARIAELEEQVQRLTEALERAATATTISVTTATTASTTVTTEPPTTTTQPSSVTMAGSLTLTGLSSHYIGQDVDMIVTNDLTACVGHGGFDDIGPSAQVTVSDQNGTLVGTSSLDDPQYVEVEPMEFEIGIGQCIFTFMVEVPGDKTFYSVEVAHRGGVTFSREDLERSGWWVELSLGR
jgi:hypothetical protein